MLLGLEQWAPSNVAVNISYILESGLATVVEDTSTLTQSGYCILLELSCVLKGDMCRKFTAVLFLTKNREPVSIRKWINCGICSWISKGINTKYVC